MLNNNRIGYLHFWCQKVLPLVYDNSLSYYEVLLKVRNKLNEVIKYTNEIPDYIDQKFIEMFDDEHLKELISEVFRTIEDAISTNNEGTNTHFSTDYPTTGTLVWHDNKLYETMHPIDAGDTVIPNSNIKLVNFGDMFNEFLTEVKTRFTDNDDGLRETSSTDRPVHDLVWLNDTLYEVIKPIAEGNAYIYTGTNKNVEPTNLDKIFDYLLDLISSEINAREAADDTLQANITAVNEALSTEHNDRISADNTINTRINNVDSTLTASINNEAQLRQQLETTLVTAISENNEGNRVTFSRGYGSDTIIWWNGALYRTNNNVLEGANISSNVTRTNIADELKNSYGALEYFRNKKVLIAGDSLSNEEVNPPNWVVSFRNELSKVNATVTNISFGGSSWSDGNNPSTGMAYKIAHTDISDYDILIIESGTNDCTGQIAIGSWSTTSGFNTFIGAIWEVFNYISANNADMEVYWCIPPKRDLPNNQYPTPVPLNVYRAAIQSMCRYFNWGMIDWNCGLPNLNPLITAIRSSFIPDALHPSSAYAPIIADYTIKKIIAGGDTSIGCVLSQCEYTSFGSGVTGVLRFNYDTSGHVHVEFQLTLIGITEPVKLITAPSDIAALFPLPMLFTQGGLPCTFEYITDGFYIVPKTPINGDYLICQMDYDLDKLISRGVWSF